MGLFASRPPATAVGIPIVQPVLSSRDATILEVKRTRDRFRKGDKAVTNEMNVRPERCVSHRDMLYAMLC